MTKPSEDLLQGTLDLLNNYDSFRMDSPDRVLSASLLPGIDCGHRAQGTGDFMI